MLYNNRDRSGGQCIMYTFHLEDEFTDITLNLKQRITLIGGDSGQGKSFLAAKIRSIQERQLTSDALIVDSRELLQAMPYTQCKLIIIDRMEQYTHDDEVWQAMLQTQDKFFIIYPRGACNIPFTPESLADIVVTKTDGKLCFSLRY